jgi:hypothetical protein
LKEILGKKEREKECDIVNEEERQGLDKERIGKTQIKEKWIIHCQEEISSTKRKLFLKISQLWH